jgi:hypothetical protein
MAKYNRVLKKKKVAEYNLYSYQEIDSNKPEKDKIEFSFYLTDKPFTFKTYSFKNTNYAKVSKLVGQWFKQAIAKQKGTFEKSIQIIETK